MSALFITNMAVIVLAIATIIQSITLARIARRLREVEARQAGSML